MQVNRLSQSETRALEARAGGPSMLDLSTLEELCRSEIESNRLADPTSTRFSFELLRCAVSRDSQQAREAWQRCLGDVLRNWLHRHPRADEVCRVGGEEGYLARTFECFWRTVADGQLPASTSLPTVLRYLQACLNGVLLDALRTKVRPKEIPLQEFAHSEEQPGGDHAGDRQLWEHIQGLFPDVRERRVAYLLYHCNLSPRDIFCFAPQQFRDVQEIGHIRRHILERILLHSAP
jgi:hypothetical protein